MLSREMYSSEYIQELHKRTNNDPALLERVIYAFGLLEAIRKVGLPFCFKGGTALMLLLDPPRRLSTDIDIIVEPGTDIDKYIRKAGEIFPFYLSEEHIRVGKNNIEKRHFHFKYHSPNTGKDVSVLLDVLFEKIHYVTTVECPIRNKLLLTEGEDLSVIVPDANGILGDKLTAFAPHTTGIPFGVGKELEVIKQLFDCASLFNVMSDFKMVKDTYNMIVKSEMKYRGLLISTDEVLRDTIRSSLCIASQGHLYTEDYPYFKDGVSRIRSHIIGGKFNAEIAGAYAARILYLTSAIISDVSPLPKLQEQFYDEQKQIKFSKPKSFSYLRIVDPIAYSYVAESSNILSIKEL